MFKNKKEESPRFHKYPKPQRGFTLIELLLVIALLAILMAVTIIAINPARQLEKSRDAERSADTYMILGALHQYAVDHDGVFPEGIGTTDMEICRTESLDCAGRYDLSVLTDNQDYLVTMPTDPRCTDDGSFCSTAGVGYFLHLTTGGKLTISAPYAEGEESISITR